MSELVSIIIPTYGGGEYLDRSIQSVLSQTYQNIEVVVVDDNGLGTANQIKTADIMSKYVGVSRVVYVVHDVNKNGSAARNTGFKNSHGQYIGFLDDDDIYLPKKIEVQITELKKLDASFGLVYCSNEVYNGDDKISEAHVYKNGYVFADILKKDIEISTPSMLIKRSAYEYINGFDESFVRHQDLEFLVRLTNEFQAKAVDFVGFRIYITNRNNSKKYEVLREWREHYLEKMTPYISKLPKKTQKNIYIYQRLDPIFYLFLEGRYRDYFRECRKIKAGYRAYVSILKKVMYKIKNMFKISH